MPCVPLPFVPQPELNSGCCLNSLRDARIGMELRSAFLGCFQIAPTERNVVYYYYYYHYYYYYYYNRQ
jgi:hypothetical protein